MKPYPTVRGAQVRGRLLPRLFAWGVAGVAWLGAAGGARAQCDAIDFEDLPVGTAVTNQYPGVTFSVFPQSCGGAPSLSMRIVSGIAGGTSSGSRCLRIDTGCPDFSPDSVRMVFAQPQSSVSFTLGPDAASYTIRRYSTTSGTGGEILPALVVPLFGGAAGPGVHRFVEVTAPSGNMRRIEITASISLFEAIDDLRLSPDTTPPTARIDSPGYAGCLCGIVSVTGVACDGDGAYAFDKLEYRAVDAPPGSVWTLVGTFGTPLCAPGLLYSWDTTALPTGFYSLRLTAQNACGLSATDERVVYVDQAFTLTSADIGRPAAGAIIGGNYCVTGTVDDECFENYTVMYRPVGGVYAPVDPMHPTYTEPRVNQTLGVWNTASGVTAVPDGDYQVRVRGTDTCGHTAGVTRNVTVDNTDPVVSIAAPASCAYVCGAYAVVGTVSDAHLQSWVLEYTGGSGHGWTTIASGTTPVVGGTLGVWNTAGLPRCSYTLRLRAEDAADTDCCGSNGNTAEYTVGVHVGPYADCNGDGVLSVADFGCFQTKYLVGCP